MTIGKSINKLRTNANMSQEQFQLRIDNNLKQDAIDVLD